MSTPTTFEARGHCWQVHTPGDPPPIDKKTPVRILDRDGQQWNCNDEEPYTTEWWSDSYINPIIGWRYTTPQEPDELATLRAERELMLAAIREAKDALQSIVDNCSEHESVLEYREFHERHIEGAQDVLAKLQPFLPSK